MQYGRVWNLFHNSHLSECSDVWRPILGICALHLTHPSAHTHTHREHTPGAVGALLKGLTSDGDIKRWLFTPPPLTILAGPDWDLNPQPSGYKSDSLSIRPRLPPKALALPIGESNTVTGRDTVHYTNEEFCLYEYVVNLFGDCSEMKDLKHFMYLVWTFSWSPEQATVSSPLTAMLNGLVKVTVATCCVLMTTYSFWTCKKKKIYIRI